MFPISWSTIFRKKDGSLVNMEDAISSGGGGGYTLPTATASRLGGVKIGSGVSVEDDGTISVSGGGGGSSLHLYDVTTNQLAAQKAFVLTTYNGVIDSVDSLKTAILSGIGFIYSGQISGNANRVPVFLMGLNNYIVATNCTIDETSSGDKWATSTKIQSGTISSVKIF